MNELRWYDKLLQWLGLMTVARHDRKVEEAYAERDVLIAENERCAGLMSDLQQQADWSFADLRRAQGLLYETWVELNDGHTETAKHLLDTYFRDDDDDFCDGGDDDALCTETPPADSGGVPEEP